VENRASELPVLLIISECRQDADRLAPVARRRIYRRIPLLLGRRPWANRGRPLKRRTPASPLQQALRGRTLLNPQLYSAPSPCERGRSVVNRFVVARTVWQPWGSTGRAELLAAVPGQWARRKRARRRANPDLGKQKGEQFMLSQGVEIGPNQPDATDMIWEMDGHAGPWTLRVRALRKNDDVGSGCPWSLARLTTCCFVLLFHQCAPCEVIIVLLLWCPRVLCCGRLYPGEPAATLAAPLSHPAGRLGGFNGFPEFTAIRHYRRWAGWDRPRAAGARLD
jgi:hypothetical protein